MMPSSGSTGSDGPNGGSTSLRRWGPIVAIVAVIAIVGGIVLASGGDDDEEADAGPGTTAAGGTTTTGDPTDLNRAITFTEAQEQGLDVTFMDSCDMETGRVKMPYYFAPECYANVEDNGGATDDGVTADTIKVVVYVAPESDPVLDFITAAISNDDTNEQIKATYEGYTEVFNSMFQTYGRRVELEFLDASGTSTDEVAARADAVRAVEEMGAFAVWGGPTLTPAWTEEITARDVLCIGCLNMAEPHENQFSIVARTEQAQVHLAEYIEKKLAGKPAAHAGDESMHETERVFGHLFIESSEASLEDAEALAASLSEAGVELAEQLPYTLDPARLQEQATAQIARFKDAGVTSLVVQGDPVAWATFTREATAQDWFPEWIIGGSALIDTAAFGRTYDQEQWSHAFGISSLPGRIEADAVDTLYEWWFEEEDPANNTEGVISPQPAVFFQGLQAAGPNLTTESMRQGLYNAYDLPEVSPITSVTFSYGENGLYDELGQTVDQGGIDDFTEIWWDADEVGEDELERVAPGMYRYVDGGQRHFPGSWNDELKVFDETDAVTIYTELPESEASRITFYDRP